MNSTITVSLARWWIISIVKLITGAIVHLLTHAPLQMLTDPLLVTTHRSQNLMRVNRLKKAWYQWKNTIGSFTWNQGPDVDSSLRELKVQSYSKRSNGPSKYSLRNTIWLVKKSMISDHLFQSMDQKLWSKPYLMLHRISLLLIGIIKSPRK